MKNILFLMFCAHLAFAQFNGGGFSGGGGAAFADSGNFAKLNAASNIFTGAQNVTDVRASDSVTAVTVTTTGAIKGDSAHLRATTVTGVVVADSANLRAANIGGAVTLTAASALTLKAPVGTYTYPLEVFRSDGTTSLFGIRHDKNYLFGDAPVFTFIASDGVWDWAAATNKNFRISGSRSTANTGTAPFYMDGSFSPTSGTSTQHFMWIKPTINQTGGANGISRGIYIDPTLTAAADWRAIEIASGAIKEHSLTAALTDGAPTTAQINSALGVTSATTAGAGYQRYIKDTDGTALMYRVVSDGTNWWTFTGAVAP